MSEPYFLETEMELLKMHAYNRVFNFKKLSFLI